jgi:hypothetical protein
MLALFICWWRGHAWSRWDYSRGGSLAVAERDCGRCGAVEKMVAL